MSPEVIWADILFVLPAPSSMVYIPKQIAVLEEKKKRIKIESNVGSWKDGTAIQSLARQNAPRS